MQILYSYFEKGYQKKKKMRTRQSMKVMWNMINTLLLTKTFNKNELLSKKQNFFLYIFYTI